MGSSPVDGGEALGGEPGVGAGEAFAAEEAGVGGEGGGVRGGEDEVLGGIDEGDFGLGLGAPEEEDDVGAAFGDKADEGVGEGFPAFAGVREGGVGVDGENGVEEEDALLGPGGEVAAMDVGGAAEVGLDFGEDVAEGGRRLGGLANGEGEAVGVAGGGIWVLPEDDGASVGEGAEGEGGEEGVLRGKGLGVGGVGVFPEGAESGEFRGLEEGEEGVAPISMHN